ncbi:Inorganic pyrophosphatase 2 [Dichanthelium oligosanthes]|uniref:Inorganic pyrophosphatase 2 n=1 Tax=Dichanthelium oligosanthes TaxID=888268 RepID=A0A1E5VT98_9POAL|nr:Inorganic pyrophosphatase 2 [Dichanthelium oligosanthes]
MAGTVIVFDFDKTIIDVDSDNWVVDSLGFTEQFERLLPSMPWNTLMDTMMGELHAAGKTLDDVAEVLRRAPIDPRVPAAIRAAYALGCDLRVLSDANAFFIETILEHHGLRGCFTEINTNPSHIDADGRLRIGPYHEFRAGGVTHGCGVGTCPPNMCKGQVLDRILREAASGGRRRRVIYLGDGRGDYCPSLRLAREDFMMPRRGYPVWDLIVEDPARVQAEVHPWADGAEMEATLLGLVRRALVEEAALLPLDCKLESMPVAVQDGMPMPLGVKN